MEGDALRWLSVEASLRGIVDYSLWSPSAAWFRAWATKIIALRDRLLREEYESDLLSLLTAGTSAWMSEDSIKANLKSAQSAMATVRKLRRPWIERPDEASSSQRAVSSQREAFVRLIGDPSDPAFLRRMENLFVETPEESALRAGDWLPVPNKAKLQDHRTNGDR